MLKQTLAGFPNVKVFERKILTKSNVNVIVARNSNFI